MIKAAVLTSPGRGAVASIAMWGEAAPNVIDQLFLPASGGSLVDAELGRILFGQWRPSGEEIVVCRRAADEIEIHCHGGQASVQTIVAALVERRCQLVPWAAWSARQTRRPIAVEALEALASANTLRCATILLDQFHGALDQEVMASARLIESSGEPDWQEANRRLGRLADRYRLGQHLIAGFRIVVAGKPNVGKSSLINALAGYERAIVFNQPGTTRDILTLRTAIDGWPVEVCDTPGLRNDGDCLEAAGMRIAAERMSAADLILLVFDASHAWRLNDEQLAARWPRALLAYNKGDLAGPPAGSPPGMVISALTGQGIDPLLKTIAARLVPEPPPAGAAVPFSPTHEEAIQEALRSLDGGNRLAASLQLRSWLETGHDRAHFGSSLRSDDSATLCRDVPIR